MGWSTCRRPIIALCRMQMPLLSVLGLTLVLASSCAMPLGATRSPVATTPRGQGPTLLFASFRNDSQDLFLEDPATGELRRLTRDPAADGVPSWSPDGSRIAFVRFAVDGASEIHVIDSTGSADHQVTNRPGASQILPSWSPDARRLAYASVTRTDSEILTILVDGTGARQLATDPASRPNDPQWSPDGSLIAFTAGDPTPALYVVTPDGGEPRRVTEPNSGLGYNWPLMWAPDSSRLAFAAHTPTGKSDVFIVARDGSGLADLTAGDGNSRAPAWSPDGSQVAFWSDRDGGDFYTVPSAGGTSRRLTIRSGISAGRVAIAWSPDGRELAVWNEPVERLPSRIFVVEIARGTFRPLPGDAGDDSPALWRPAP